MSDTVTVIVMGDSQCQTAAVIVIVMGEKQILTDIKEYTISSMGKNIYVHLASHLIFFRNMDN